jgi:polyketide synthase-associated protein
MDDASLLISTDDTVQDVFREHEDQISQSISFQGFCTIQVTLSEQILSDVSTEIDTLDRDSRLKAPPEALIEGLLGDEGSTRIAELREFDGNDQCLAKLSDMMGDVHESLQTYLSMCSCFGCQRTDLIIHRGGLDMSLPAELNAKDCKTYIDVFSRQILMILLFLGPGEGCLELQPFDSDSNVKEIRTKPGMMVVLRADLLSHRHTPDGDDSVLSRFVLKQSAVGIRQQPVIQHLHETLQLKLQEVKDKQLRAKANGEEVDIGDDLPFALQLEMNRSFWAGQRAAIRGVSTKQPGAHDPSILHHSLLVGSDLVVEVPLDRWDHRVYYDPDPLSYEKSSYNKLITTINHAGFMDGTQLFDSKFFGLSAQEAKGTSPDQRLSLECAYEVMHQAGHNKKSLAGAYMGCYMATGNIPWNETQKDADVPPASLGGMTISAARTSFSLGIRGPCITFDNEGAASLICSVLAVQSVVNSKLDMWSNAKTECPLSLIGSSKVLTTPWMWPRTNNMMSVTGRCYVFDDSANGHVETDCVSFLSVGALTEKVDGKEVLKQPADRGAICGWRINSNGMNTSMSAPNGAQQQEVVTSALRQAGINPWDMDAIECHGQGQPLHDAIEATSLSLCLRPEGAESEVLQLGCVKTNIGHSSEPAGAFALIKMAYCQSSGYNPGNVHLRQLNPHIDLDDDEESALVFSTEAMEYRASGSYHGVTCRSWNGTNVHVIMFGQRPGVAPDFSGMSLSVGQLCYWPGGGGAIAAGGKPAIGYSVVGSLNNWNASEDDMVEEETGSFTRSITIGDNCQEIFQIWLDGDPMLALSPGSALAMQGSAAEGPMPSEESASWTIVGEPGESFTIRLMVAGKYRAVAWEKRSTRSDDKDVQVKRGNYYISGSFNSWEMQEMCSNEESPGVYWVDIPLSIATEKYFYVVRNKDWSETFCALPGTSKAVGPIDAGGFARNSFAIPTSEGGTFRITFTRAFAGGVDEKYLTWEKVA